MRGPLTGALKRGVVTAACLAAGAALGQPNENDRGAPAQSASGVASTAISVTVSDPIVLPRDAPIALTYTGSPKLTAMLREALATEGFHVSEATDPGTAALVRVRGVLQLTGKHTARIPIAALAERATTLDAPGARRALALADAGYVIAAGGWLGHLTRAGELGAPAGGVLFLDVIGQATGAKDWFNRAIGGDRRGICLANCADWQKTRQAALHIVEYEQGSERSRMQVKAEVFTEALQPGAVVSAGLASLIAVLSGRRLPVTTEPAVHDDVTTN